jgi:DNA-binding CsgD family transcriptional regulator/energy-coupling factor transporter ATP-binding protein EcfA2
MEGGRVAETPFIGRERELAELSSRLRSTAVVTVTGPRGCGKTRLAREAAGRLAGDLGAPGALVLDLATVRSAAQLARAIERAIGRSERHVRLEPVARRLASSARVVVLDDCGAAAAAVRTLVTALPTAGPVRLILTSREPLQIPGETVLSLRGLSLPEPRGGLVEVVRSDAARFLVARAVELDSAFALTPAMVDAVLGACSILKGVPLDLESAAHRLVASGRSSGFEHADVFAIGRAGAVEREDLVARGLLVDAARVRSLVRADRAAEARTLALETLSGVANDGDAARSPVQHATAGLQTALAMAELAVGDLESAERRVRQTAESRTPERAQALEILARVDLEHGDTINARGRARQLDRLAPRGDSLRIAALARYCEGYAALHDGDHSTGAQALYSALSGAAHCVDTLLCIEILGALGALAASTARPGGAARLLGAAFATRARMRLPRLPPIRHEVDALERLGAGGDWTTEWSAGEALSLDQAVTYARRARGPRSSAPAGLGSLTPTEHEVAKLATAGASNPRIATELFMARGTVKAHLASIYRKLGVANRTALAGEMARADAATGSPSRSA